jgi:hypothetical protein
MMPHRYTVILQDGDSSSIKGIDGTGFLRGARIGIVAKPSAEFVAGIFGTWLSGGVAVPLALSYPEVELLHVMNDSVCSKLITLGQPLCGSFKKHPCYMILCNFYIITPPAYNTQGEKECIITIGK